MTVVKFSVLTGNKYCIRVSYNWLQLPTSTSLASDALSTSTALTNTLQRNSLVSPGMLKPLAFGMQDGQQNVRPLRDQRFWVPFFVELIFIERQHSDMPYW